MLAGAKTSSSFAVNDIAEAKSFYGETLGLKVTVIDEQHGLITLNLAEGHDVFVYAKPDFAPATYTVLNFKVEDIDAAVDDLTSKGVSLERYDSFDQDDKDILRGPGPSIAWFKDPAGNVLSVLQQPG